MDYYIVFTGNEFGLDIGRDEIEFIPLEDAEEVYEKYVDEHGCAAMYGFTGYSLVYIKSIFDK